jgi:hypothetical protein
VACNFLTTRVQWARGRDAAKPAHVGEDVGDDVGMWLMCDSCWRLHQGAVACGGAPASSPQSQSPLRVPGCAWLLQLRTEAVAGAEGAVVIAFTRWWCWAVVTASNPVLVNGHMKAHSSVVRLNPLGDCNMWTNLQLSNLVPFSLVFVITELLISAK